MLLFVAVCQTSIASSNPKKPTAQTAPPKAPSEPDFTDKYLLMGGGLTLLAVSGMQLREQGKPMMTALVVLGGLALGAGIYMHMNSSGDAAALGSMLSQGNVSGTVGGGGAVVNTAGVTQASAPAQAQATNAIQPQAPAQPEKKKSWYSSMFGTGATALAGAAVGAVAGAALTGNANLSIGNGSRRGLRNGLYGDGGGYSNHDGMNFPSGSDISDGFNDFGNSVSNGAGNALDGAENLADGATNALGDMADGVGDFAGGALEQAMDLFG